MNPRLVILTACAFPPLGCMTPLINQAANRAQAKADRVLADHTVARECPTKHIVDAKCGLITNVLGSAEYRERFKTQQCARLDNAACQDRYDRMVRARLELRYSEANFAKVVRVCDAHPGKCDALTAFEEQLLESHNSKLRQVVADVKSEIEAERQRAVTQDIGNSLGVMREGLHIVHDASKH